MEAAAAAGGGGGGPKNLEIRKWNQRAAVKETPQTILSGVFWWSVARGWRTAVKWGFGLLCNCDNEKEKNYQRVKKNKLRTKPLVQSPVQTGFAATAPNLCVIGDIGTLLWVSSMLLIRSVRTAATQELAYLPGTLLSPTPPCGQLGPCRF